MYIYIYIHIHIYVFIYRKKATAKIGKRDIICIYLASVQGSDCNRKSPLMLYISMDAI